MARAPDPLPIPENKPVALDRLLSLTGENIDRHGQCLFMLDGLQGWVRGVRVQ